MQFISNGPDVLDTLLQAHEEGRVVFFCGAGISYPAGLPGFGGLVDKIYKELGTRLTDSLIEEDAFKRGQFDTTLDLLERRIPGHRLAVRKALHKVLKPKLRRKGALDTHTALLHLALNREGIQKIVTTNFDQVFEYAARREKITLNTYPAPMLPIPKNSRWDGLVYLHGRIPNNANNESELNRLITTSGDFGLAYLSERWAARFISELFRNYIVCFIGYSINDPILRYMMDALAADRMLGEDTPQAYAFGDYSSGGKNTKELEWKSKGVIPILYEAISHDHSALHNTLKEWAETYRDGILGKERIVLRYARTKPTISTEEDNFIARVRWALSDKTGLPAKKFANLNPVPSLAWLEIFSDNCYGHNNLSSFGVTPQPEYCDKLAFSLIQRPMPYTLASKMSLIPLTQCNYWDNPMKHLANWLTRHLNDPELILWLTKNGAALHQEWIILIEDKLNEFAQFIKEGNTKKLEQIKVDSPNAIPNNLMQILWRLLLTDRVKTQHHLTNSNDIYSWWKRQKREGLTTSLRLELRKLLSPKISLKRPFSSRSTEEQPTYLSQLVNWDLVLNDSRAYDFFQKNIKEDNKKAILPSLLNDLEQQLMDALDLFQELKYADEQEDPSYRHLPSIEPHWQNRGFHDWVLLIELLRDAWLVVYEQNPTRAKKIAVSWYENSYPTFKRLALFSASQTNCISSDVWVDWLIDNNAYCLWSHNTKRETIRLLVLQADNLSQVAQQKLEEKILLGPTDIMNNRDIEQDRKDLFIKHSIWFILNKLQQAGCTLGTFAQDRLRELTNEYPNWQLANDERDEFSTWMSGTGDPGFEMDIKMNIAPEDDKELAQWIESLPPSKLILEKNNWEEVCSIRFYDSLRALHNLSKKGVWPTGPWKKALYTWSKDDNKHKSWQFIAPLISCMEDKKLQELKHAITWWLKNISKLIDRYEDIFYSLCRRILTLSYTDTVENTVMGATNHPIGFIAEALLDYWIKKYTPNDNDTLPAEIKSLFNIICDISQIDQFRYGRTLLCSRLITLFRADPDWTAEYLLPIFDWSRNSIEAKVAWQGFLWSPRIYPSLQLAFKHQFLDTAYHYQVLEDFGEQYVALLTFLTLESIDGYTVDDFRRAIHALPQEGLQDILKTLTQTLEDIDEQKEEYWKNRIQPFWQNIWPKSASNITSKMSELLARLIIATGKEFPIAFDLIKDYLQPVTDMHTIMYFLESSKLEEYFPEIALELLYKLMGDHFQSYIPSNLKPYLEKIIKSSPDSSTSLCYTKLIEYIQK